MVSTYFPHSFRSSPEVPTLSTISVKVPGAEEGRFLPSSLFKLTIHLGIHGFPSFHHKSREPVVHSHFRSLYSKLWNY